MVTVETFNVEYHTTEELEKMTKQELIDLVIYQEAKIRYLMNPDDND